MMRSLYSGVSGLKNHQTRMDVIGNNIANVNTVGYKKSRVVFKDAFYQATRGASAPTTERGGINPMAVGLGATLASIDQIHTPAPTTTTNKTTDLAVDGNGYFAVNNGSNRYYTRAGAFDFDTNGNFYSTSNGYKVQGWTAVPDSVTGVPTITSSGDPKAISIASFKALEPQATTKMQFTGNLDSSTKITPAQNEIQRLTFAGGTIGTNGDVFRLQFDGQTTGWIQATGASGTTATNIQNALAALTNIGTGNVAVNWSGAPNNRYDITFQGGLAATDVAQVQFLGSNAAFNGGAPAVAITQGVNGVSSESVALFGGAMPTQGDYTLTYNGATTAPIPYNASAAQIQAALIAATPALSGNINVANGAAPPAFNITFINTLANTNVSDITIAPVAVATTTTAPPVLTQLATPTAANTWMATKDVFDSLGNKTTLYFRYMKYEVNNAGTTPITKWACDISRDPLFEKASGYTPANLSTVDLSVKPATANLTASGPQIIRLTELQFDDQGKVVGTQPDPTPFKLTVDKKAVGAEDITFGIDFNSMNQFSAKSDAWASKQNGYKAGALTSYTIGTDGVITGIYDNEEQRSLARVALFTFENPSGLKQAGGSLFTTTSNSGDPNPGVPGESGKGAVIPGSLEMSNVDLSDEFTDMIVTQRGFQANSRIITTSDEMLQELVNLKR